MAVRTTQEQDEGSSKDKLLLSIHFLKVYWKIVFAITWASFLTMFIFIFKGPEIRCAYTIMLMSGYWITECFPMAVTSLLPLVLFPMLGVLSTAETCSCYMNDTIMVFIGGMVLAVAIEHCNLHLRIALGVMKTVGCSHARLLAGVCAVTTFTSMWVSNTAATAMMVPIIFAILHELEEAGLCKVFDRAPRDPENPEQEPELVPTKLTKAYLMAAAYCSTFGGTGTLVGTGTNLTFKGIYESSFPAAEGVNFTQWMIANIPQMIINSFVTWIYLRIVFTGYLRPRSKDAQLATIGEEGETITNRVIQERYKQLGGITFHETSVAVLFGTCIFLWIFRKPGVIRGWSEAITDIDIRDSTPVIFVSILMFFIPRDPSFIYICNSNPERRPKRSSEGLITWNVIEKEMPWSLMFLLGGGFAISKGSIASGLAHWIGNALLPLRVLPPALILILISMFVGTFTELTSNVGIANIALPVIAQMSVAMKIHPMYLMIPAAIMCSYSFRLPVGTPPNAIISMVGRVPIKCLIIVGFGPSIYSLLIQSICFFTWSSWIYAANEFPSWAAETVESTENSP